MHGNISRQMSKKKTELTQEQVKMFLQRQFAGKPENVQPLVEGEESQALSYECSGEAYVLRIHHENVGFQKDAYAAHHFHSEKLPIPRVLQIGSILMRVALIFHRFSSSRCAPRGTKNTSLPYPHPLPLPQQPLIKRIKIPLTALNHPLQPPSTLRRALDIGKKTRFQPFEQPEIIHLPK